MKHRKLKLTTKIWLVNFSLLLVSVIGLYFLSNYFYERLYVKHIEGILLERTEKLNLQYESGLDIEDFQENIERFSNISFGEVYLFLNTENRGINDYSYGSLSFSESEKLAIQKGETVSVVKDDFLVVVHQLKRGDLVEGLLLTQVPMTGKNFTKEFWIIWILLGGKLILLLSLLSARVINKLVKPFKEMKHAVSKVTDGNYDTYIHYENDDEIGSFARAFNKMSSALQKEDERKKDFLSDVSHELRTPLSYIKGYTHVLLDGLVKKPEKQRQYLKLIARETNRMENLVQDLLDLTKIESNLFEINKHPIVLAQCIEDVMMRYRAVLKQKHLSLKMNLDPDVIINGDEIRLEQIIQNVVENAVQYSINGGILAISLTVKKNECVVEIADNGIGMSEQDLRKVTERFYRVNKARTRLDGGAGIGLSIVEKLMILHGGTMEIESQLNVGTKVRLFFPIIEIN